MEKIQYIGIQDFTEGEQIIIKQESEDFYEKISSFIEDVYKLTVHLKDHSKGGKTKKYELDARVTVISKVFESSATEFDLKKVLNKGFEELENELKHKLRIGSQKHKQYE